MDQRSKILEVHSLSIFQRETSDVAIVENLQLQINEGEVVGLFGDSGSGKTLSMLSLIGLSPAQLKVQKDISYYINGREFRVTDNKQEELLRRIRSKEIAFVFQQAASCLNPLLKVRRQLYECIDDSNRADSRFEVASKYLSLLGFEDPKSILNAFPHELSVGQQQRVMLAQALVREPKMIIADEPFAGLDMLTASNVRALLRKINRETGVALVVVSHDLRVLSGLADRYLEIKDKTVIDMDKEDLMERIADSKFMRPKENDHAGVRIMKVVQLEHAYKVRGGGLFSKPHKNRVLNEISLELKKGEILGIMGMSGSGKSTLGRMIAGLEVPDKGEIFINDQKVRPRLYNGWRSGTSAPVQMVFQDPYTSFDPSKTIAQQMPKGSSLELLRILKLEQQLLYRTPGELSGGQLQRMSLARALMLRPEILVLDESFSAIDIRSRETIIEFVKEQSEDIGIILISHLPDLILSACDRLVVLKSGRKVASGPISSFDNRIKDPWIAKLLGFRNEVT